jgi:tetratricopeptide (TPR) repeat protein
MSPRAEAINHYIAATLYEQRGQFDSAITEMQEAAKREPDSPTLCVRLIRAYLHKQDYENARIMAEKAVGQRPENANLWIVLGEIYHQLGRSDDAVQAFQKAIATDPGNILGYGALVSVEEGANDLVAAVDIYKKLAELTPGAAGVHFQLGLCLARMNDAEGAKIALKRALELNPALIRAVYLLGVICLDTGATSQAAEYLTRYIENVPEDVQARENLAGAFARMKKFPEAIGAILPIFSGQKTEPRHYLEMMYLLLRAERYKEAEEMLPPEGLPFLGSLLRAFARKGVGEPYLPIVNTLDAIEGDLDAECTGGLNELLHLFGREEKIGRAHV